MKKIFQEYYTLDKSQYIDLWKNAFFIFDTNIFLNLYRYSSETRDTWFYILEQLKERLWMPYQIGFEYHENRIAVISEVESVFDKTEKIIKDCEEKIQKEVKSMRYPSWENASNSKILNVIESSFKDILKSIENDKAKHPNLIENDFIMKRISEIYLGKVGNLYTDEQIKYIFNDGRLRYEKHIPPGYMDADKKDEQEKYGDLIIWKQIIDKVLTSSKPIIFITDDVKEDWWKIVKGKTIGARVELIKEFYDETEQVFYMYTSGRFIKYLDEYLGISVNNKVKDEIEVLGETINTPLTEREFEVLMQVMKDKSNSEISKKLYITHHTIKAHLSSIMRKLKAESRSEALLKYMKMYEWNQKNVQKDDNDT